MFLVNRCFCFHSAQPVVLFVIMQKWYVSFKEKIFENYHKPSYFSKTPLYIMVSDMKAYQKSRHITVINNGINIKNSTKMRRFMI